MSPAAFSCFRWWDTAGEDISTMADRFMTHSSQWQRSQKIRTRLGSAIRLKISAATEKSSVSGTFSC